MFIKKLIKRKEKIEPDHVFCLHDLYFVINFETETIVPIIFNNNYSGIQRLDTMEVIGKTSKYIDENSKDYTPKFIIPINTNIPSKDSIRHNDKYYDLNHVAIRILFAKESNKMNFLSDIQILNAEQLDLKYNLARKFKTMRKHVYSPDIAYIDSLELAEMISFITTSKSFRNEIESYNNKLKNDYARQF